MLVHIAAAIASLYLPLAAAATQPLSAQGATTTPAGVSTNRTPGTGRSALARSWVVSSTQEIESRMQSAQGGDRLVMSSQGSWADVHIRFVRPDSGPQDGQITLVAESPGAVRLTGTTRLSIGGKGLVVKDLVFEDGALTSQDKYLVEFRDGAGSDSAVARGCRLTDCYFKSYNPLNRNQQYSWVGVFGQENRVDHCTFEDHDHKGSTVLVVRNESFPNWHRIDHNYFRSRPRSPGDVNGWESLRIGTSATSLSDSCSTVEHNLFERANGEIEIISNKSGANTYRYNVFLDCQGTLTLRHGNGCHVLGNWFLGNGRSRSGGIRVIGRNHIITDNFIHQVDNRAGGAISVQLGHTSPALNAYARPDGAIIGHNSILGCEGNSIQLGAACDYPDQATGTPCTEPANGISLIRNLVLSAEGSVVEGQAGTGWIADGNLAFGFATALPGGSIGGSFLVVDPLLTLSDSLWRATAATPTVPVADLAVSFDDVDGQRRSLTEPNPGADEFDVAAACRERVQRGDVGPGWLTLPPLTTAVCTPQGCVIQGEDYARNLDPDLLGRLWYDDDVADASAGKGLVAGSGDSTLTSPGALAVFKLIPAAPSLHRAYFRVLAPDPGSKSFFVPTELNADPATRINLAPSADFQWYLGLVYSVEPQDVGTVRELRVGRRESGFTIDAIVLSTDLGLTVPQLEALLP